MQKQGYIKLHRKILEDPIMLKPNYLAVWIYILLRANYEDAHIIWNNKKTLIKRGSFIGSISKMSKELGIPMTTVNRIIDYLISENQIEKRSNNKFTLFKVIKYNTYQAVETKTESKRKASGKLAETNKKNNKNKNNNIISKPKDLPDTNKLNEIIDTFYKETKNRNLFSNKTQRKALEDLIKDTSRKEVVDMIEFAFKNKNKDFCPQISSPRDLQYKWSKLKTFKKDIIPKEKQREAWSFEKQLNGDYN